MTRFVLVVVGALVARPVAAQQEIPAPLQAAVTATVAESWGVPASDVRLEWGRLPEHPLPADAPFRLVGRGSDGWFAVVVNRPDASPYALRVRAGVRVTMPVATRALTAGHAITEDDVQQVERVRWGVPAGEPVQSPIGAVTRRAVAAGDLLRSPTIAPPTLVTSGDRVRVTFQRGGVTVSATGTAVGRGALGETISVRLDTGYRRIRAVVVGTGAVQILK